MNKIVFMLFVAFITTTTSARSFADEIKPFRQMSIEADVSPECVNPKPPRDLAPSAIERNNLRSIRKILALRMQQNSSACSCPYDQSITWSEVIVESAEFETPEGSYLRFDTDAILKVAKDLENNFAEVCS